VLNPEQVIANPIVSQGALIVNSYIASATQACTAANPTGWTTILNPATGGGFPSSYFVNSQSVNESAVQTGANGSPNVLCIGAGCVLITNTSNSNNDGTGASTGLGTPPLLNPQSILGIRMNWAEVR
jgi:Tfp pilus tip-associated adhesin PilY1